MFRSELFKTQGGDKISDNQIMIIIMILNLIMGLIELIITIMKKEGG